MAKRIHSARFLLECETHHTGLHMVLHGISLWSYILLPWVHIFGVTHMHILDKGMVHPIGGVCSFSYTNFFLFCPGGTYPETMKFTIFAYRWYEVVTLRSISSHRKSFIGGSWLFILVMHDKWSATEFSTPFLSLISRSNSWSRRIHLINLSLASFLVKRYLSGHGLYRRWPWYPLNRI